MAYRQQPNMIHRFAAFASLVFIAAFSASVSIVMNIKTGYVANLLDADSTYITYGLLTAMVIYAILAPVIAYLFLTTRIDPPAFDAVLYLFNGLKVVFVSVGLIGTVIGFMAALGGVDPSAMHDITRVGPMVTALLDGMAIALTTTLVGTIAAVYAEIGNRLLVIVGR